MARHFTGPAARFPSRAHRALPRDARGCIARVCAIACILRSFRGGFPRWWRAACRQATGFERSWLAPVVSDDFPWARRCACAVRRGVRAVCGPRGGFRDRRSVFSRFFFVTSRDILRCESKQIRAAPPRPKDPRRFGNFAIWSTATQSGFAVEMTLERRKVPCSRLRCGQIRVSVLLFAQWFQVSFSVVFFLGSRGKVCS